MGLGNKGLNYLVGDQATLETAFGAVILRTGLSKCRRSQTFTIQSPWDVSLLSLSGSMVIPLTQRVPIDFSGLEGTKIRRIEL